jgi:light-regulated signal transduction histidine kinase (bacteriophytochrome)
MLENIINSKLFSSNKKYIKSSEEEVEFLKTRKNHLIRQNIEKIQNQSEFLSMIQKLDERIENEIRQINKMRDTEKTKSALKSKILRFLENLKNSDWQNLVKKCGSNFVTAPKFI